MPPDDLTALLQELAVHRLTVAHELGRAARYGGEHSAPPEIAHYLADARAAIARLKTSLRAANVTVEDLPTDVSAPPQLVDQPIDLTAAQEELDKLPTETIPAVATALPPGSRPPYHPNPLFTGRDDELRALALALAAGDANVIITGMGGIGKTTLAIEAAWRYGRFFLGGVFWVSCAEAATIPAEIAACGGPGGMRLPGLAGITLDEQVQLVCSEWARELPRLLIFDNCEEPALLQQYRPRGGGCRVLVTSRNAVWPPTVRAAQLALDVLAPGDSVALLQALCARLSDEEAAAVYEALGRLPLALHLAGSFLNRYKTPVAHYLEALDSPALLEHASLTGRGMQDRPTGRAMHVAKAFALSVDRLDANDPVDAAARALLARAACLAPGEPFPQTLLEDTLPAGDDDEAALTRTDGVERLLGLGLLERAGDATLKLHRLLARYAARALAGDDAAQGDVEEALFELTSELNRGAYPLRAGQLQAHLRFVVDHTHEDISARTAGLCNNLGFLLQEQGNLREARPYYERALVIREQVFGLDHSTTAVSLNNLGYLLCAQDNPAAAMPYYERALEINEQVCGVDHPRTANSLNNLGYVLQNMGDYSRARLYYERALAIRAQALGQIHPDTANSLNNLGSLLQALGDLQGARAYFERALAIREQALGPNHPDTTTSLNNLGYLLQALGDLQGAREYRERALTINEQVMGSQHPDTATSLNNLGYLLQALGDLQGAREYLERAGDTRAGAGAEPLRYRCHSKQYWAATTRAGRLCRSTTLP